MVSPKDFDREHKPHWCPGCGNFPLLNSLKSALAELDLAPHQVMIVTGIGQAAKSPHFMSANMMNGLHGRALPVATGIKLANPALNVIVQSGDGCNYGEGGNHFMHALRRNPDMTLLVHNNQIYGLTKGQASPTTDQGFITNTQPLGNLSAPFNPIAVAISLGAPFVARTFAGMKEHMVEIFKEGIKHKGLSVIDILQPCPSFNKVNTFQWYKERAYELPDDYDPSDREQALKKAFEWGDKIPIGVIWRSEDRPVMEDKFPALQEGDLVDVEHDPKVLKKILEAYG